MRRRRGITLIEVLVAIFIMAIGLLAILTLFPLGALRMGEALQNDRTAASASAGANLCDGWNIRTDPGFYNQAAGINGFLNPGGMNAVYNVPAAAQNGSGYPLYVDPYGLASGSAVLVGNAIPRVAPTVFPTPYNSPNYQNMANRYFTLLDDATFLDNGLPDTATTGNVQRAGRYTWAYLLHRPQPASPTSPVDLTVVVYAARSTSAPSGETTYTALGQVGDTNILLSGFAAGQFPNIKRGSWVLDTTFDQDPTTGIVLGVHGLFYRVVSVSELNNTTMNLEVRVPLAKSLPVGAATTGQGYITVLDNVVDVFSRGTDDSTHWEFRNEQ